MSKNDNIDWATFHSVYNFVA